MSDDINKMDFKQLRNEVQLLRDELAIMKRKYEDIIYNLDDDNFSSRLVKEKDNMKTAIEITAEGIKTKVSKTDFEQTLIEYSTIEQTASNITMAVNSEREYADKQFEYLSGQISVSADDISAIIRGEYTSDLLDGYLTGIKITPHSIKMIDDSAYSVYNKDGLAFYDASNQKEGWSIEPSSSYGGVLNYYINDGNCYRFGTGESGEGYDYTDMTIKAINSQRGRFVVDVKQSSNKEVKFLVGNHTNGSPLIYVNESLLATQDWVLENGGGSTVAVFG